MHTVSTILLYRIISIYVRDRDHMVVEFTTTYAISAYHHWCCEFKSVMWDIHHTILRNENLIFAGYHFYALIKLIIILNVSEKQCQPNGTHITDTQIPLVSTPRLLTSRTYKPLHTTYLPNTSIKSSSINNTGLLLGLPLALVFAVMIILVLVYIR
jgi:hypothetical protein